MEFVEALQEFLFHQGFQKIKYDSKILWGKDTGDKLSLLEVVPPLLPGRRNARYKTPDYAKISEKSGTLAINT